jgi:nucleoside phosphorylase
MIENRRESCEHQLHICKEFPSKNDPVVINSYYMCKKYNKIFLSYVDILKFCKICNKISERGIDIKNNESYNKIIRIGVITALPKEYAAVKLLLEDTKEFKAIGRGAGRRYLMGNIPAINGERHTIALSLADKGNNAAATRATLLLEDFPNVDSIIMVGIAGGLPCPSKPEDHVRLGDIVISNNMGVIQYDLIKEEKNNIIYRPAPKPPSSRLLEAVKLIEADELLGKRPWLKYIDIITNTLRISRPSCDTDILTSSTEQNIIIPHPDDPKRIRDQPRVFIGSIAASNTLLKNPIKRDLLRDTFGVKAIEMESSGIADATWNHGIGYLVIRGICDYCDMNKNDSWQFYAAAVAAGYLRALIQSIPV